MVDGSILYHLYIIQDITCYVKVSRHPTYQVMVGRPEYFEARSLSAYAVRYCL